VEPYLLLALSYWALAVLINRLGVWLRRHAAL
jgi:ABC-type amino acid transport system permease subunit